MTRSPFADSAWRVNFTSRLSSDPELRHLIRWSAFAMTWRAEESELGSAVRNGHAEVGQAPDLPAIVVQAAPARWEQLLRPVPPPWHTDLLGMARRHDDVALDPGGNTLVRNLRTVNRIVEVARAGR